RRCADDGVADGGRRGGRVLDCGGNTADLLRFGSVPVESPADTLGMISAACAQLGERALVCTGGVTSAASRISSTSSWWAR
ncbi:putative glycosyltransferase domain protein, partial [Mycobacterium xenopi 3993]